VLDGDAVSCDALVGVTLVDIFLLIESELVVFFEDGDVDLLGFLGDLLSS